MGNLIRNKNFYLMVLADAGLVIFSYFFSYLLRFEGQIPWEEWEKVTSTILYILPFKLFIFVVFGLYGGMWRYTSLFDLFNVLKAVTLSSSLIVLVILFAYRFEGYPRSVFIIDWILTFILIGGIRVTIRFLLSEKERGLHFLLHNPFVRGEI